jgi:putative sigma-54 modulation protein
MPVEVDIYGRNMEVSDRIFEYVTKKVSRLDRYLSDVEDARVDLAYSKAARNSADRHVAQITIRGKGFILRSEERADDIFAALDTAVDKMQRQMERYKGKRNRGRGDGKSAADVAPIVLEERQTDEEQPIIGRRKRFVLTLMDELEAIEQMSLLGHDAFFVFYNMNTNSMNVLYRRRDGSYGLIEPEIG